MISKADFEKNGYWFCEDDFAAMWRKQVGPLLLTIHNGPELKIDVYQTTGIYYQPLLTFNFMDHPGEKYDLAKIESGILEFYKKWKGLS